MGDDQISGWIGWICEKSDDYKPSYSPVCRFCARLGRRLAAGIPVWHGSEVDLGILDAASLHACAAVRNCTLPSDTVGTLLSEDDLILEPLEFCAGFARVPEGTGLGVTGRNSSREVYHREVDLKSRSFLVFSGHELVRGVRL